MGSGSWSSSVFVNHTKASSYNTKSTHEILKEKRLHADLDPKGVVRESRDSADNPESTPVIIALDVTGSMSTVIDSIVRNGLDTLCKEIFEKKPIKDPHIAAMGIGDVEAGDEAPLQVSQFEADIRILKDIEKIWLEGGGGGNRHESYLFPLYFAATATKTDSFEKRQKKGFIFTIGDEEPQEELTAEQINLVMGANVENRSFSAAQVLSMASKQWNVYHVIIEEGSHASTYPDVTKEKWRKFLGQRVISLPDHKLLAETIVSTMMHAEGLEKDKILKAWDPSKAKVIGSAMKYLP